MKGAIIPTMLAGTLLLGGCAQLGGLGGVFGGNDRHRNGRYGNDYGYGHTNNSDFERAAVRACGRQASQYGRVRITYAGERDRGVYTVQGRIEGQRRDRDQFTCAFDQNGRITDFRFG